MVQSLSSRCRGNRAARPPGFCPTSSTTLAWLSSPTGCNRGPMDMGSGQRHSHKARTCACAHHIGVRGVRQPKRSPVVLPIQRRLFRVQLVQPAADLSTPQQSLAVLRKLHQEEQSLNMTPPPTTPPDALITGVNLRRQVPSSRCWSVRGDSGSARFFHQQKPK